MTLHRLLLLNITICFAFCGAALSQAGTCNGMTVGQLTTLNGFVPFSSASLWNTDISTAPVDPNSANYINFIGSTVTLHPDFGSGTFHNQTIGIPYQVVAGNQANVQVKLNAFADESDPGPEPIRPTPSLRAILSPATATATYWCLKRTDAGYTNSTMQA